ncbi:MAG: DUF3078 domain-containing protein [Acidobacteria bacterium]|nr:DUF3078 domain-containing protein [Acidobacteriota bacterium]
MFRKMTSAMFAAILLLGSAGFVKAQDNPGGWQLDLKRVSLNLTSTQVKNADVYADFPDSRLNADSQTLVQGFSNFEAAYSAPKYLWSNELLAEYGKTTIKPLRGEETKTESADRIILTSDIAYKIWKVENFLGGFDAGPMANVSYETEFTSQNDVPLRKLLRGRLGAKAFEGKYLKSLYAAMVFEEDFTFPIHSANTAWEIGLKIEQPIREGVKTSYGLLYRDYLSHGETLPTNLDYTFEANARMDVLVYKNLSIAPFVNYYMAQGKYTESLGQNVYLGVSFSFSKILKAR